ncbi:glutathione S-transferase protein [Cooperia oncophora]
MVKGKLYGHKDNFRTQKVLIAAKLGNADLQLAGEVPPADKFPLGVTPAFEGDVNLFGAESIAIHVAGCESTCAKNCAETVQWLQWAEGTLLPTVLGYVLPSVSAAHLDKKVGDHSSLVVDTYKAELFAQLTHLDEILLSKTFLVGERLSLADVSVALDLLPAFQHVLDAAMRKKFGNVTRWFQTIMHQPAVKDVVKDVQLCDKVSQFNQAKFNEISSKHQPHAKHTPKKEG